MDNFLAEKIGKHTHTAYWEEVDQIIFVLPLKFTYIQRWVIALKAVLSSYLRHVLLLIFYRHVGFSTYTILVVKLSNTYICHGIMHLKMCGFKESRLGGKGNDLLAAGVFGDCFRSF